MCIISKTIQQSTQRQRQGETGETYTTIAGVNVRAAAGVLGVSLGGNKASSHSNEGEGLEELHCGIEGRFFCGWFVCLFRRKIWM